MATVLLVTALSWSSLWAEQPLIQPSWYGVSFEGPALSLECVATLKNKGEGGLVESFRAKSSSERRLCLAQLLQSLTPEPDFTPEDFQRSLKQTVQGQYELAPDPAIAQKMTNRMGVNVHVAQGLAELAGKHLIDDASALRPLVECLNHPLLEVGKYCNRALVSLTRHTYGLQFYERSTGAPAVTLENRHRVVADWRELNRLLTMGHPIFDELLASECLAAIRAVGARLIAALRPFPAAEGYLRGLAEHSAISPGRWEETIINFDVGSHNTANWPQREAITRIALVMTRPGVSRPSSKVTPGDVVPGFQTPDYREIFPALDLELRFAIGTSDEALRRVSVLAVKGALDGLRAVDAKASR